MKGAVDHVHLRHLVLNIVPVACGGIHLRFEHCWRFFLQIILGYFFAATTPSLNVHFSWQGDRGYDGESGKQGEAVSTMN